MVKTTIEREKSREKGRKMPSKRTRKKGRRPRAIAKWNIIKILTILLSDGFTIPYAQKECQEADKVFSSKNERKRESI